MVVVVELSNECSTPSVDQKPSRISEIASRLRLLARHRAEFGQ